MTLLCRGLMRCNSLMHVKCFSEPWMKVLKKCPDSVVAGLSAASVTWHLFHSSPLQGWRGESNRILESTAKWNVKFGLIKKDYIAGITNCKFL